MNFWSPKPIAEYEDFFRILTDAEEIGDLSYALRKNLGYNAQYIEYLCHQLNSEGFHSVIDTHLHKSLILTTSSSIEGIMYCALKRSENLKMTEWEKIEEFTSNNKTIRGSSYKTEVHFFKKVKPKEDKMGLDWMIRKCQNKSLLGNDQKVYSNLKKVKKLRNKIHLFLIDHSLDTDWNNFTKENARLVLETYASMLDSKLFQGGESKKLFAYLYNT